MGLGGDGLGGGWLLGSGGTGGGGGLDVGGSSGVTLYTLLAHPPPHFSSVRVPAQVTVQSVLAAKVAKARSEPP